jgi:hypothetical protein
MKKNFSFISLFLLISLLQSCIITNPDHNQTPFTIDYTIEIYHQSLNERYVLIDTIIEENVLGTFVTYGVNYLGFTLNKEISNYIYVVSDSIETIQIYYDRNSYDISFYTYAGLYQKVQFKFGEIIVFPEIHQVIGWKDVAGEEITTNIVASQDERFYAIEDEDNTICL